MEPSLRDEVIPADREKIRIIVESNRPFFLPVEVQVALDLLEDRLAKKTASEYQFILLDVSGHTVGFSCYGAVACSLTSYELYWIAVHQSHRHWGYGQRLLKAVEERIARLGGTRIYIDTSGRREYEPTRKFYRDCHYRLEAVLKDFYGTGDDKYIYKKVLGLVDQERKNPDANFQPGIPCKSN